jgi:PII-like signaling protein
VELKLEAEQVLCRFQTSNRARHGSEALYQWILKAARAEDLQGATVLAGCMGLRADGAILHESPWALAQDLPVIVEVIDGPRHLTRLLQRVEPVFSGGTITLERAHVVLYRGGMASAKDAPRYDVARGASTVPEVKTMNIPVAGVLLRIFLGESDHDPSGVPLYEALVRRAREAHLAGATVLRGPMGFGRHSHMHTARLLEMSTDLPIVIEIVDAEDKIRAFLPTVDALVSEGLVTLEAVRVLKYASPAVSVSPTSS